MAVHYAGGGGGLLGALAKAAGMVIPGAAPYVAAGTALANGDPLGAAAGVIGNVVKTPQTQAPNTSLTGALMNAHRRNMPDIYSDPVTGGPTKFKRQWEYQAGR